MGNSQRAITDLAACLHARRAQTGRSHLCRESAGRFLDDLVPILVPARGTVDFASAEEFASALSDLRERLIGLLLCVLRGDKSREDCGALADAWFSMVGQVASQLEEDARFIHDWDPAAYSVEEVELCYPGLYAIAVYRLAHALHGLGVVLLPRLFAELAHEKTGIDIHPAAEIASPVCIDHGTGLVIGETTRIGSRVKIYQGVTLGALSVAKDKARTKRHPTIEQDCVIYSNATILGGETVIGAGSVIGGSVWLTKSVPPGSRVFHAGSSVISP